MAKHGIEYHAYADDTQLFTKFKLYEPLNLQTIIEKMESCITDLKLWLACNKLKVNDSKTEFMVLYPKRLKHKFDAANCTLNVGNVKVSPVDSVKNLGIIIDKHMSMEQNINSTIRSAYFHLRRIGKIRSYLDHTSCALLVHSLVTSRLDYNNSLLPGLPSELLKKLQTVQNHAARLVARIKLREHITPVLRMLHWLPISQRIKYKMLVLTYKCVNKCSSPAYLQDLLNKYKPGRTLRSSEDTTRLHIPSYNNMDGQRSFSICAPKMWNVLPVRLREINNVSMFKKHLKTYLFNEYFNQHVQSQS